MATTTLRAIGAWLMVTTLGCGSGASAEGGARPRPPAPVDVSHPTEGSLVLERTYFGLVRALSRAQLAAGADGEVREVTVREGDHVVAGQVLVRLDPDLAQADLLAARAQSRTVRVRGSQAAREAVRLDQAGRQLVGELEIERAHAQAHALNAEQRSTHAAVARAQASLARHEVTAPFEGIVSVRHVDPGDWVGPGQVVVELVADARSEVMVRVEPGLLEDVDVGSRATVTAGTREVPAHIEGIVRALDPVTRTAQLRLRTEPAPWLLPGATVDVHLTVEHAGEGLLVPRDALVEGVTATRVVRVVDGLAHPLDVEVVERGRDHVRVRAEGLRVSDVLVTRGNERLTEGQAVRVLTP